MLHLKTFCFNPFQENTVLLYTDAGKAWLFDPGNSDKHENAELKAFIDDKKLKLERLFLTHAHIDHILGCAFVHATYGLLPECHENEVFFIKRMPESAKMYGVQCEPSPLPEKFIKENDVYTLDTYAFKCLHTPGHSPGSICFYNDLEQYAIVGDVLFNGSIGRTDLPGGDYDTLIQSIKTKLLVLDDATTIHNGHGPSTTIGDERKHNPFLR